MSDQIVCFNCGKVLSLTPGSIIGRSETCNHCDSDVRVCRNCKHYNEKTYNECNESQAERVLDKTRNNFCDYFHLIGANKSSSSGSSKEDIKAKLDALFKS